MAECQAAKEAAAFFNFKHTAERNDGVIPVKYRELVSVAVAMTTQCSYCVEPILEMPLTRVRTKAHGKKS